MPLIHWILQNLHIATPIYPGSGVLTLGGAASCRISRKNFRRSGSGSLKLGGSASVVVRQYHRGRSRLKFNLGDLVYDISGDKWMIFQVILSSAGNSYLVTDGEESRLFKEYDLSHWWGQSAPDLRARIEGVTPVPEPSPGQGLVGVRPKVSTPTPRKSLAVAAVPEPVRGSKTVMEETRLFVEWDLQPRHPAVTPVPEPSPGLGRVGAAPEVVPPAPRRSLAVDPVPSPQPGRRRVRA